MKKFTFSLEKVLSYRNQIVDVLKNELSTLMHELDQLDKKIDKLHSLFSDTNAKLVERMAEGVSAGDIAVYKLYLGDITGEVKKKQRDKQVLQKRIELKQAEIIAANVEIASLDKLKEKQLEEYRVVDMKAQELELNEFFGSRVAQS